MKGLFRNLLDSKEYFTILGIFFFFSFLCFFFFFLKIYEFYEVLKGFWKTFLNI